MKLNVLVSHKIRWFFFVEQKVNKVFYVLTGKILANTEFPAKEKV